MKHIVRKAFWDYEKEEKWLNEMSVKGLALTDYSWCRYVFVETPSNEYTYRIELMENIPTHPESIAYIKFLEDTGVECVATYNRWIYLRKKSSEGEFDVYSDIESKIKHYKRVDSFWNALIWLELIVGLMNILIGTVNLIINREKNFWMINIILGCSVIFLGLLFIWLDLPIKRKIKSLQREKEIKE